MTPEFSRRSAVVLGSSYFSEEGEDYADRLKEFYLLRDAIVAADSLDDLSEEARDIWDRAEQVQTEYDARMAPLLAEGYERFHGTDQPSYTEGADDLVEETE